MSNRYKDNQRSFSPKTIGQSIEGINKKFSHKYGKIEYLILLKWPEIVGSFFANHSEPQKITSFQEKFDEFNNPIFSNCLHINVSSAAAVEFQHYMDKIIEKINSYFGYKAISEIRIHQKKDYKENNNYQLKMKENSSKIDENMIKKDVNGLEDKDLEKSIIKLGVSISKLEK